MPGRKHRALAVAGAALITSALVMPSAQAATDPTSVSITAGVLSLGTIAVGDFGGLSVTGAEQTTTATMDSFDVSDLRGGRGGGWHVTAQASQFSDGGTNTLPASSLEMAAPVVDPTDIATNVSLPPTSAAGPHTLDSGAASTIASAEPGGLGPLDLPRGTGVWTFNSLPNSLTLTVPADVVPATYTSTVTMTVIAGP